jgi:hypothetical protein
MNFQKLVLIIATILLIVILFVIGYSLSYAATSVSWPPMIGACPDYWEDLTGKGESCLNSLNLGRCNIPSDNNKNTMNFNVAPFNTNTGLCSKYNWAKSCKVTWDGLTSGVPNPCTTK